MNLSKLIEKSNQNANFTGKYDKNKALHKKLMAIGGTLAAVSFVVAAAAFVLIGVFGNNLKSIQTHTALLISMFVLLVVFSIVFGVGIYILRQAQKLNVKMPQPAPPAAEQKLTKNLNDNQKT